MGRAERLTQVVKQYDSSLYAVKTNTGMFQIWRREYPKDIYGNVSLSPRPLEHFILALTDDWSLSGKSVDWGIDPLMIKLKSMDNWRDDCTFDNMVKRRNDAIKIKEDSSKGKLKDIAYDLRKDFAKVTNDIIVQK